MSEQRKTILITGATGNQGGALIETLLAAPDAAGFSIVAVSRNVSSGRAQKLAAKPNVSVVGGDLTNPEDIFVKAPGPVWGVYSVQVNSDAEEAQGKAMIDAAVAHGVRHFVYASGDRGGPERSAAGPTDVKNFAAKYRIEKHLEAQAEAHAMTYTILRPVSFFENLAPGLHGAGFARMWAQMGDKPLQLVSTRDIGWFAAQAFLRPEEFRNTALSLAGDELTQKEADVLFREAVGFPMPMSLSPIASAIKFFLKGTVGDMFRWFEKEGSGGDVADCHQQYPEMRDFKAWITENKAQWIK